jgi:hypothetical protein
MGGFNVAPRDFRGDVSVDGDHDAQQYLIGFEDSSGNFVEAGRFNNTADDVTQPLEIKHTNSGERITLDSSGFKTQKIDDDRFYAGAFPGTDADARLSNCLSASPVGATVFLERATYFQDITINLQTALIGQGLVDNGTDFAGSMTMTLAASCALKGVHCQGSVDVVVTGDSCLLQNISAFGSTGSKPTISVDSSTGRLTQIRGLRIELKSNSLRCVVDSSTSVNVIDNGIQNVIGDIA